MTPFERNSVITNASTQTISSFMNRVYVWMMVGIFMSGLTAYVVAMRPDMVGAIMQNRLIFFGLIIFQLVAVVSLSAWVQRMSIGMASLTYALYTTSVGLTTSVLFLVYSMSSISSAFFITAFAFGGLSLFGYLTKRDLGPLGSFCMIGLFGMIGIMLLGIFIPSMMNNTMQMMISIVSIIIFAGLTAYDTQKIKALHFQFRSADESRKGAIYGALILYLDFINLFLSILRLVGDRK